MHSNQIKNTLHEIPRTFNEHFPNTAPEPARILPPTQMSHKSSLRGDYPRSMEVPITTDDESAKVISALEKKKKGILTRLQMSTEQNRDLFA